MPYKNIKKSPFSQLWAKFYFVGAAERNSSSLGQRRDLKNLCGPEAPPHKKAPRLDIADGLDHSVFAVQKNGIDRKAHKERMDGIAPQNQHAFTLFKALRADEPPYAFKKSPRHLRLYTV